MKARIKYAATAAGVVRTGSSLGTDGSEVDV